MYPVASAVRLSFFSWRLGESWTAQHFVGLSNYTRLLGSSIFHKIFWVTLIFAGSVVAAELGVGLGLALLLERPIRGLRIFRSLFVLPMMIAPVAVGLTWRFLYSTEFGIINWVLQTIGLSPQPWLTSRSLALWSIIIADIWQWTPFMFIILLAGLQTLPLEPLEASIVDGASPFQVLAHIKLPLMKPIIGVAILLRVVDAFRVLEVVYIMTFGGPGRETELIALHIYKVAFMSQRLGRASALSLILLAIILAISTGLLYFVRPTGMQRT